jgi:hypothetical protein
MTDLEGKRLTHHIRMSGKSSKLIRLIAFLDQKLCEFQRQALPIRGMFFALYEASPF